MHLRKIQKSDNQVLATLIRQVFDEHNAPQTNSVYSDPTTDRLYEVFQAQKSILWVAEVENEIVGCCGIYPTDGLPNGCAELVKFYLSANARGKGIGKALMQQCMISAKELGYTEIYLESFPAFSDAVNMYEKQGYVKLTKPLGNSGHTACTIWMLKKLV